MSCSAINCHNRKSERPELLFFRFPLNEELRRRWVVSMKREKMKGEDKPWEPSKHTRLCSQHFRPEDIDHRKIYRKLNRNAIPCIFSWPNKSEKPQEPEIPQELPPIVFVDGATKKRQKRYQKKEILKKIEQQDAAHSEQEGLKETVHVDLNNVPLRERLEQIEKMIDNIYVPQYQHIDLSEEIIKDVSIPQNQPIDLKEEIIEDVHLPQNQPIDIKKEIIDDVDLPHNQPTDLQEEIIEDVYIPQNQPTDLKEEIIEDVGILQNQPIDLKEEIIEDVYMTQNQPTDLKEEIIEDIYMPQNQLSDVKEEIEDIHLPQNQSTDLKEEMVEDVDIPQNHHINLEEKLIETVYLPQQKQIDLTEPIIEDVFAPQNQEEMIEDIHLSQNERFDMTEEIIEDSYNPQHERIHSELKVELGTKGEENEQLLQLEKNQIGWLKNLVNKNNQVTLCRSQKLKRLSSSKAYFQRKLSAMNKLLEELNSLE